MRASSVAVLFVTLLSSAALATPADSANSLNEAIAMPAPMLWTAPQSAAYPASANVTTASTFVSVDDGSNVAYFAMGTVDGEIVITYVNTATPTTAATSMTADFARIYGIPSPTIYVGAGGYPGCFFAATTQGIFSADSKVMSINSTRYVQDPIIAVSDILTNPDAVLVVTTTQLQLVSRKTMLTISAPLNNTLSSGTVAVSCGSDGRCWIADAAFNVVCMDGSSGALVGSLTLGWSGPGKQVSIVAAIGSATIANDFNTGMIVASVGSLKLNWLHTAVLPLMLIRRVPTTSTDVSLVAEIRGDGVARSLVVVRSVPDGAVQGVTASLPVNSTATDAAIDASSTPYLLVVVCGYAIATYSIVSDKLTAAVPEWSSNSFGISFPSIFLRTSIVELTPGVVSTLSQMSFSGVYLGFTVNPRTGLATGALQLQSNAYFRGTYVSGGHTIALVGMTDADMKVSTGWAGVDISAVPMTTQAYGKTITSATQLAVTQDKKLNTYLMVQASTLELRVAAFGAAFGTLLAQLAVLKVPSSAFGMQCSLAVDEASGTVSGYGTYSRSATSFGVTGFAFVVDVASGSIKFAKSYPGGYSFATVCSSTGTLIVMTSQLAFERIDLSTGSSIITALDWTTSAVAGVQLLQQQGSRLLLQDQSTQGFIVMDAKSGSMIFSFLHYVRVAQMSPDGGVVICDGESVSNILRFNANGSITGRSLNAYCGPLYVTPDAVYTVPFVRTNDMRQVYLVRVNFTNSSTSASVPLYTSTTYVEPTLVYSAVHQLMVVADVGSGVAVCVDLIRGTVLWSTSAPGTRLSFGNVNADQFNVAGAQNVLWSSGDSGDYAAAINMFTGEAIEIFTAQVSSAPMSVGSVAGAPVVTFVSSGVIGAYTKNLVVRDIRVPAGFRSASLPLFPATDANAMPQPVIITMPPFPSPPSPAHSSPSTGVVIGAVGGSIAVSSGIALLLRMLRCRRRQSTAPSYAAMAAPRGNVRVAEGIPLNTEGVTHVTV